MAPPNTPPRSASTNPRTPSTHRTTIFTPPTTPSRSERSRSSLRRSPARLELSPSPPSSVRTTTSTNFEHAPGATGPLADFARTSLYPPLTRLRRPVLHPPPSTPPESNATDRSTSSETTGWEYSSNAPGPLADFARSGLYPPNLRPSHPAHPPSPSSSSSSDNERIPIVFVSSEAEPPWPRTYNDVTDPSARPAPTAVPPRVSIDTARHFDSTATPPHDRAYPETTRRPTAADQLTAELNRMLSSSASAAAAAAAPSRYSQLPPMKNDDAAAPSRSLSVRRGTRDASPERRPSAWRPARPPTPRPGGRVVNLPQRFYRVEMAAVPDWGVLGTVMPFPEVGLSAVPSVPAVRDGYEEEEEEEEEDGVGELTRGMAALSIEDDAGKVRFVLNLSAEAQRRLEDELADALEEPEDDGRRVSEAQFETAWAVEFQAVQARLIRLEARLMQLEAPSDNEQGDSWGHCVRLAEHKQAVSGGSAEGSEDTFHTAAEEEVETSWISNMPVQKGPSDEGDLSTLPSTTDEPRRDTWSSDPDSHRQDSNDGEQPSPSLDNQSQRDSWGAGDYGQEDEYYDNELRSDSSSGKRSSSHTRPTFPTQQLHGPPRFMEALSQAGLSSLLDLPEGHMHTVMSCARANDAQRNEHVQQILDARAVVAGRRARRPSRRLNQTADRFFIEDLQMYANLLWAYDRYHWPCLEPLEYERDRPVDHVVHGAFLKMHELSNWNPDFNWAEPFAPRQGRRGDRRQSSEDVPVSPKTRPESARGVAARTKEFSSWF